MGAVKPLSLGLVVVCVACATSGTPGESSSCRNPGGDESLPRTITPGDLARIGVSNAREAIEKLRPDLLEPPRPSTAAGGSYVAISRGIGFEVGVYVDGELLGGPDELRDIPVARIEQMEWLNRCEALERFQAAHPKGALLITTTGRSGPDHP